MPLLTLRQQQYAKFTHPNSSGFRTVVLTTFAIGVGPITVILGIYFFVLAKIRTSQILHEQFSVRVETWEGWAQNVLRGAEFTVNSHGVDRGREGVGLGLVKSGGQYQSFYFESDAVFVSPSETYTILTTANGTTHSLPVSVKIPNKKKLARNKNEMNCKTSCTGDFSSEEYKECMNKIDCLYVCGNLDGYMKDDHCVFTGVLEGICLRVKTTGEGYRMDWSNPLFRNKIGCFAENGFEPGVYVAMTESIHWGSTDFKAGKFLLPSGFQVRDVNDPYLYLHPPSGLSQEELQSVGSAFVGFGIVWRVCVLIGAFFLYREVTNKKKLDKEVKNIERSVPMVFRI